MATKKSGKRKASTGTAANGIVTADDRSGLAARAEIVNNALEVYINNASQSFVEMAKLLAEISEKKLWIYLANPKTGTGFKNLKEYGVWRFGDMGRSKVYELVSIGTLTKGPNALTDGQVKKLGTKKAAALARMEPKKRTPEVIERATAATFAEVEAMVHESVNEDLPEDQRTEITVTFARTLAISVAAELEKLEAIGINMEGIRNADRSVSRVSKFWGCAVLAMRHYFAEDLVEAEQYIQFGEGYVHLGKTPSGGDVYVKPLGDVNAEKEKVVEADAVEEKPETDQASGHQKDDVFPDYENESQARGPRRSRSARP